MPAPPVTAAVEREIADAKQHVESSKAAEGEEEVDEYEEESLQARRQAEVGVILSNQPSSRVFCWPSTHQELRLPPGRSACGQTLATWTNTRRCTGG